MFEYLSYNKAKQYEIDCTFKIIPRSYKPYKLMTIYALDNIKNRSIIATFICLKYTDYNSLLKIYALLRGLYIFSPERKSLEHMKHFHRIDSGLDVKLHSLFKQTSCFVDKSKYNICRHFIHFIISLIIEPQ